MQKKLTALLALAMAMLAACGTRLPDSSFEASTARAVTQTDDGSSVDIGTGTDSPSRDTGDTGTSGATGTPGVTTPTGSNTGTNTGTGTNTPRGPNVASDIGITATTITLGNITAENGVLGDAFAPAVRGMRAWTAAINAAGGINGRKVILKTCDDREDRARSLACAQRLVEQDKVFAIVGANSRSLGGASQYLNDKGVPVLGMPINNAFYRYPHFWSTYAFGYPRDGKTVGFNGKLVAQSGLARWFKENLGATKAAVFEYDVNESKQAGDFFAEGLRKEQYADVTVYLVSFAAPSFDQAVADMQRRGTDLIMDSMDDGANRKLCDAMARRNFKVKAKVSTVVSMGDAVGTTYNDTCRNSVFIPGETLPYTATSNPVVAAFRKGFARYQPGFPLHQWALEAWGLGNIVKEGIEKGANAPTRKILEDYLRSLDKYQGNGLFAQLDWKLLDYSKPKAQHCFTIARWLDAKGGWVSATDKFPFCYQDAFQYGSPALEQGN